MLKEQLKLIFLAKLAGTPVFDPNGDRVGKVRDAVVANPGSSANPRILGFIVEIPQRRRIFIPATRVTSIEDGGLFVTGSINIPLQNLAAQVNKIPKGKPVITCCASGMRSASGKSILANLGFEAYNGGPWGTLKNKMI